MAPEKEGHIVHHGIVWDRPSHFRLSDNRRYTPDFYIPSLGVYIDPKSRRVGKQMKVHYDIQILKIKQFELEYSVTCIVITEKKNLTFEYIKKYINEKTAD